MTTIRFCPQLPYGSAPGQRGQTARQRGDSELRARPSWQPELGLRPQRHATFGSSSRPQQNGLLALPQDLDAPLRLAAQRKINNYRQQYADNQSISFLPSLSAPPLACTANFGVLFFYRLTGRPSHTLLPMVCHCKATTRTCSVFAARPSTRIGRAKSDSRRPKRRR
jgi:hypothetical protein